MLTMIGTPSAAEIRQVMRDEGLDAVVIEADRVEHAGGGFDRSPRRVAGARLLRDRLRQDAAQAADIDEAFHLAGVAERARGDEDRIRQPQVGRVGRRDRHGGTTSMASRIRMSDAPQIAVDQILNVTWPICNGPDAHLLTSAVR